LASRGLGWRIHESVEDTKLSTNKQHSLSQDLRRGRHSSSWIALWSLRMITLHRSGIYKVQRAATRVGTYAKVRGRFTSVPKVSTGVVKDFRRPQIPPAHISSPASKPSHAKDQRARFRRRAAAAEPRRLAGRADTRWGGELERQPQSSEFVQSRISVRFPLESAHKFYREYERLSVFFWELEKTQGMGLNLI